MLVILIAEEFFAGYSITFWRVKPHTTRAFCGHENSPVIVRQELTFNPLFFFHRTILAKPDCFRLRGDLRNGRLGLPPCPGGFVFVRVPKVILIVVLVGYLLNEQRLGVLVIGPSHARSASRSSASGGELRPQAWPCPAVTIGVSLRFPSSSRYFLHLLR